MCEKYRLTNETETLAGGRLLHRIQAVRDTYDLRKGQLGGFVEDYLNLSQDGSCWVYPGGRVYNGGRVTEDSKVGDGGCVREEGTTKGNALVYGVISGLAVVDERAIVQTTGTVTSNAFVGGGTIVHGTVCGFSKCTGHGTISHRAIVDDSELVGRGFHIGEYSWIVRGSVINATCVPPYSRIFNGDISSLDDIITAGYLGSRKDYTTAFKDHKGDICISCGCFKGTLQEFICAVKNTHPEGSKYRKEYLSFVEFLLSKFNLF